ncbi:MAG: non-ribosomal peptide synthetase, partial [Chloroflexi bacterium]
MENVADIYPLTPTQQGILYHTIRAPESEVYFEQIRCMLDGPLDVLKMQAAWDTVVERHPVLRTAFLWEGLDTPLQVVRQTVTIPWDIRDWQTTTETVETQLEKLAGDYRQKGFNLAKAPLLRMVLVKLADERHHFIWNFHHLMTDGWSTHQMFKEAFDVYESLVRGEQPTLPTIKPFRNYVAWLKKQDNAAAESFWREQLAGFETPTPLQVDKRGANTSISYAEADIHLTTETTAALNALARQNRLTLGTLVQGAWAILLSRYSGEQDVSFGITLSGRPASLPGVENMVGMFINTLPLRTPVPDSQPLLPWLEQLQSRQLAVRQYEHTPLSNVQRWSDVPAGQSLFDSIVVFENYPAPEDNGQQSLTINDMRYREQSNYPLALLVVPDEQMRLLVIYNQNRFEADTIQRLLGHLTTLLAAIAAQPELTLGELPLLTDRERIQIFREWNDTATSAPLSAGVSLPPETCIHNLIAEYGDTTPDKTAVSAHDGSLTYAELITRANQLAHRLIALGVSPGTPVGLYSERSAEMGVGILGIMQAGGAYVPLDPAYPPERVAFVLADTNAPLVVSQVH